MKYLLITLLLLPAVGWGQKSKTDCIKYSVDGWHIVYNKFYKKYAVMRIDTMLIGTGNEREFLVKDHYGEYGVYSEGWENLHCYSCGDPSKSLFDNPCQAKQFILTHIRKLKEDRWEAHP